MDRTATPAARALKLALALALICCVLALPRFDALAEPGVPQAPAKVRDGARAAAQGEVVEQAPIPAGSVSLPIAAPAAVSTTATLTPTVFLPMIMAADRYLDWVSLGQPAGTAAVNYLYVGQQCANDRPAVILAGTDKGLYSYGTGWTLNAGLGANIEVSQIFSTTQDELYVSSYNLGLWRSVNGGATWAADPTPNNDSRVYGLAQTGQFLYAAARLGLYRRSNSGGPWSQVLPGAIYTVAAAGNTVYAAQIGSAKDTLFVSNDGGATWPIARQLPGGVNFVQTLDVDPTSGQVLIGAVAGGLFTLNSANNIVPFSQGLTQTVYGIWRDAQKRIYAAAETPGGLRRFAPTGGASNLDLSALPTGGSLTAQTLYTVNGSTECNIIGVGSESVGVWLRRVP
jgi:hypothetical protein